MERSIRSSTTADTNTGKDNTPNMAVIKNAQMVSGRRSHASCPWCEG